MLSSKEAVETHPGVGQDKGWQELAHEGAVIADRDVHVAVLTAHLLAAVLVLNHGFDALVKRTQVGQGRLEEPVGVLGRRVHQSEGPWLEFLDPAHEL